MTDKRRSLKIREENDKKIQYMRSQFLFNNIDIDYTTMVNIFIDIGDMVFKPSTHNMTDTNNSSQLKPIANILKKYLEDNIDNDIILNILKDYQNKNVTNRAV